MSKGEGNTEMLTTGEREILKSAGHEEWVIEALWNKPIEKGWREWLKAEAARIAKNAKGGHKGECFEDGAPCICHEDEIEDEGFGEEE